MVCIYLECDEHSKCFTVRLFLPFTHTFILCSCRQHFVYVTGTAVRTNLGISILLMDTSACGMGKTGIYLPTFWLEGDPLYLLSHSRQCEAWCVVFDFLTKSVPIEALFLINSVKLPWNNEKWCDNPLEVHESLVVVNNQLKCFLPLAVIYTMCKMQYNVWCVMVSLCISTDPVNKVP